MAMPGEWLHGLGERKHDALDFAAYGIYRTPGVDHVDTSTACRCTSQVGRAHTLVKRFVFLLKTVERLHGSCAGAAGLRREVKINCEVRLQRSVNPVLE